MDIKKFLWKSFSINKDEFSFVLPLFLIYFLSGSFYTVGQIFSETIFLKTYGPAGFSGFFIQNGIAIIIAGIIYNSFVLKLSLRKGYVFLISSITLFIISGSFLYAREISWFPFYLFMANYLFTVLLDIHFFNYAFLHLTIRNSKRILPFLMGGGKLGGMISSVLIFYFFSKDISRYGMYVWAVNCGLIFIPILFFKMKEIPGSGKSGTPGEIQQVDFLSRLLRNLKSSMSSGFFVYAILIAFVASVLNQVSEYYSGGIFNTYFSSKNELSAFLSVYTLVSDFLTLILQLFIVSKLINAAGVRKANFIYPASFLSLIAILAIYPNLAIGVLLRFLRKNVSALIKTPVHNIIMAASPADRMAEVKSFIGGIVNSAGMICGGFCIFFIAKKMSVYEGYFFTLTLIGFYLILTYFQNRSYIKSLEDRIKFDSRYKETDEDIYPVLNNSEIANNKDIIKNILLLEAIFNSRPSLDLLPLMNSHYKKLGTLTKEKMLNTLRTGKSECEFEILARAVSDSDYTIRATALSILKDRSLSFRRKVLQKRYPEMLEGEKYAIAILTGKKEDGLDINTDNFAIERLSAIKEGVMNGSISQAEFIMLIQALPYQYFLNYLYELIVHKRDIDLFKSLIPFADKLPRRRIIKIIYLFRSADMDFFAKFLMMSKNAEKMDIAMPLDYRDISFEYMKLIYNYDEKTADIFYSRLFKNYSYYNKSNYLKYFITAGIHTNEILERFIDFEIQRISAIQDLKNNISYIHNENAFYKFINFYLTDIIGFKKHLILKAVSILTGFKIDDVYESNILLRDKELDNYILEYIDTSVKQRKKILSILEDKSDAAPKSELETETRWISIDQNKYLQHFLPEISWITEYVFNELAIIFAGTGKSSSADLPVNIEEAVMLPLLERIIFLKENILFSELKINEIINLAKIAREIDYPPDKTIINEGETGDRLFIIISGKVKVFTKKRDLENLSTGSCIGELSIIDEEPRSASVVTIEKTKLLYIDRKDFLLTLIDNPAISINIMRVITGRLRNLL